MAHILCRLWGKHAGESQRWSGQPAPALGTPAEPPRLTPETENAAEERSFASRQTIVIVALDGRACSPLAHALDLAGYQAQAVASLAEAMECLKRERPVMLVVCGSATSDTYRVLRRNASIPLLALLPELAQEEAHAAFNAGVDDCQLTSISKAEMVARVHALLRRGTWIAREAGASERNPDLP